MTSWPDRREFPKAAATAAAGGSSMRPVFVQPYRCRRAQHLLRAMPHGQSTAGPRPHFKRNAERGGVIERVVMRDVTVGEHPRHRLRI
jgi:hypothetical protein